MRMAQRDGNNGLSSITIYAIHVLIIIHGGFIPIGGNVRERVTMRLFITGYDRIRAGITREKTGNLPFSLVENDAHESKSFAGV